MNWGPQVPLKHRYLQLVLALGIAVILTVPAIATEELMPSSDKPSFSPDGKTLVFCSDVLGRRELWLIQLDSRRMTLLTANMPGEKDQPTWSPNKDAIAFAATAAGKYDIWTIRVDGSNPVRLTADASGATDPAWSVDGSKLAFVSKRAGTKDIWVMNADGSGQRRVTRLYGEENHPSFSPDGARIVFSETGHGASNLMIINVDGTGLKDLTNGAGRDLSPTWGPKGIVFSSDRTGTFAAWIIQPDGSGLQQVPNSTGAFNPTWQPSGNAIAFASDQAGHAENIYLSNSGGNPKQPVTDIKGFQIGIAIKPGKTPAKINPNGEGRIPVAILSSASFNAVVKIRRTTLTFGHTGDERSLESCDQEGHDVNGDGFPDLVCHFDSETAAFQLRDTQGVLRGQTVDSIWVEGRDAIRIASSNEGSDDHGNDDRGNDDQRNDDHGNRKK